MAKPSCPVFHRINVYMGCPKIGPFMTDLFISKDKGRFIFEIKFLGL